MEENQNVTEEVTQETQDTQEKQEVEKPVVDESKFESAGADSVIKIDMSAPVAEQEQADTVDDTAEEPVVEVVEEETKTKIEPEIKTSESALQPVT